MVDVAEHVYHDDPAIGHPDVRTRLAGASYFFLGNGLIQAAVQYAPGGEGTPLGLLIMDPEHFGKKRDSLTMSSEYGLEPTVVRLAIDARELAPLPATLQVSWMRDAVVPTVEARWGEDGLAVVERFSCPSVGVARLAREVAIVNTGQVALCFTLLVGGPDALVEEPFTLDARERAQRWLLYDLDTANGSVMMRVSQTDPCEASAPDSSSTRTPDLDTTFPHTSSTRTTLTCHHPMLDHLFHASACQLPAVISSRGRLDGSIWQYNREWVRDQAVIALALTMLGHRSLAATMLGRLLDEFVTAEGATIDSSEVRGRDDVELDQNGILLHVLEQYVNWTGDLDLVERAWPKVLALATYPLRDEFRHAASGLLSGCREYWERHAAHGIEPGLELVYQLFVSLGLASAASLARRIGKPIEGARWDAASQELRHAFLSHPVYALCDDGRFVKRRTLDGRVQTHIVAQPDAGLPDGVPLASPGPHLLNPDTCAVLPIVFGVIDPASPVARATLSQVEQLWNQAWNDGGYGRYHVSSEPDSPGAWPFASVFVARAAVEAGESEPAWRVLRWLHTVPGSIPGSWFEFYGPRVAPPFPQVGIIPWTWAELIVLLVHHVLGVRPQENVIHVRPRLLSGLTHVEARLPIRNGWLDLDLRADAGAAPDQAFVVPYSSGDSRLARSVRTLSALGSDPKHNILRPIGSPSPS